MPPTLFSKLCPGCGNAFSGPARYCTLVCREREKRKRRKLRDERIHPQEKESGKVVNPSVIQLDGAAKLLLGGSGIEGIIFAGVIPRWEPPDGVMFVEQIGTDPVEWVMMKG